MVDVIEVGQVAPDFTLSSHQGKTVKLSDQRGQNVVLFFVRSPNCWQCREHVEQLGRMYEQFQQVNTEILIILNAGQSQAQQYARKTDAPFPVLADAGHQVYEQYGLPKVFLINTRTGSVVIDAAGTIRYLRSALNPTTWLRESHAVLDEVRQLHEPSTGQNAS